ECASAHPGPDRGTVLPLRAPLCRRAPSRAGRTSRRHPPAWHGLRRRRRSCAGRADRDLAARPDRRSRAAAGLDQPGRLELHGVGTSTDRRRRTVQLLDAGSRRDGPRAGSLLRGHRVRARSAQPPVHPGLPPRRCVGRRPSALLAPRRSSRHPGGRARRDRARVRHPPPGRARDGLPPVSRAL
ncbi:MAG: Protocatechuate 3,4-dioxygenase alpha chain, partial [uncultured Blastococcus sp.]